MQLARSRRRQNERRLRRTVACWRHVSPRNTSKKQTKAFPGLIRVGPLSEEQGKHGFGIKEGHLQRRAQTCVADARNSKSDSGETAWVETTSESYSSRMDGVHSAKLCRTISAGIVLVWRGASSFSPRSPGDRAHTRSSSSRSLSLLATRQTRCFCSCLSSTLALQPAAATPGDGSPSGPGLTARRLRRVNG